MMANRAMCIVLTPESGDPYGLLSIARSLRRSSSQWPGLIGDKAVRPNFLPFALAMSEPPCARSIRKGAEGTEHVLGTEEHALELRIEFLRGQALCLLCKAF